MSTTLPEVRVEVDRIGENKYRSRACDSAGGDICTHDDGPLAEGEIEDEQVVCPRHGARFNLISGAPTFPAAAPIPIYETRVEGDEVKVRLLDE